MQQAVPKLWIFFFVIIAVLIVAILASGPQAPITESLESTVPDPTRSATFEGMLDFGGNAIYVDNQPTGATSVVVGFAVLSAPGFVVVYNDGGGVPGSVIGESSLLESGGEHLVVPVDEPLVQDQVYYAMLYHDDGNGRFREDEDAQAVDSQQSVILMSFLASSEFDPESGPVVP
ncbi:MAG: hypothetical protein AAB413_01545 [Patescibacteria group bacterium]